MYRHAPEIALTARIIRAGWSGAGLFPFNPSRVIATMSALGGPPATAPHPQQPAQEQIWSTRQTPLVTPTTTDGVQKLCRVIEAKLRETNTTHDPYLQKLLHATEKAFADRSRLYDENEGLLRQK